MTWTLGLFVLASASLREDVTTVEVTPTANLKTALVQSKELRTNEAGDLPMACSDSLVGESTISASSSAEGKGPLLSVQDAEIDHAWEPVVATKTQWIEWSWESPQEIHFMQTAGYANANLQGGVKQYKLEYADPKGDWIFYVSAKDKDAGKSWTTLDGFANAGEAKMNALDPPVRTMHFRLWPTDWSKKIALRGGVRGCAAKDVAAAEMQLTTPYADIVPKKFETMSSLRMELKMRIADSIKVPVDMVQIISLGPNEKDLTETTAKVHILPKEGQQASLKILESLGKVLEDENSELFKWMASIEATPEHQAKSCADKDCGSHGDCAAGKCFCFDGYTGDLCQNKDGKIDYTHLAAAQAGEANAAGTVHDLHPLPLIKDAADLPDGSGAHKPGDNELEAEIALKGVDSREGELGVSGKAHRHKAIIFIPCMLVIACIAVAAMVTKTKKSKTPMAEADAE